MSPYRPTTALKLWHVSTDGTPTHQAFDAWNNDSKSTTVLCEMTPKASCNIRPSDSNSAITSYRVRQPPSSHSTHHPCLGEVLTHLHSQGIGEEEEVSPASAHAAPLDDVEVPDRFDESYPRVLRGREVRRHRCPQAEPRGEGVELLRIPAISLIDEFKDVWTHVENHIPGHLSSFAVDRRDKRFPNALSVSDPALCCTSLSYSHCPWTMVSLASNVSRGCSRAHHSSRVVTHRMECNLSNIRSQLNSTS